MLESFEANENYRDCQCKENENIDEGKCDFDLFKWKTVEMFHSGYSIKFMEKSAHQNASNHLLAGCIRGALLISHMIRCQNHSNPNLLLCLWICCVYFRNAFWFYGCWREKIARTYPFNNANGTERWNLFKSQIFWTMNNMRIYYLIRAIDEYGLPSANISSSNLFKW